MTGKTIRAPKEGEGALFINRFAKHEKHPARVGYIVAPCDIPAGSVIGLAQWATRDGQTLSLKASPRDGAYFAKSLGLEPAIPVEASSWGAPSSNEDDPF